jgi:arylsulfatase A-like enzyme
VGEAVGLCDVTPTLLQLAGLPDPEGVEGRRLLSAEATGGWTPAALPDAPRYSELDRHVTLRSVMTIEHHLILNPGASRSELYSVPDDPLEAHDLAPDAPAIVSALADSIARYERARTPRSADTLPSLSDEERARLRSLGYVN